MYVLFLKIVERKFKSAVYMWIVAALSKVCVWGAVYMWIVAALSKVCVWGRSPAGIVRSNPAGIWMFVSCECRVLSSRVLCIGWIACPEESYRLWCV